jgi:Flp pilus assembly protein TadB
MTANALIKTLILVFGTIFGFRIFKSLPENLKVHMKTRVFCVVSVIFLILNVYFLNFSSSLVVWILFFLGVVAVGVTIFVTQHLENKNLRQDFVFFVDKVQLHIKMGRSLRAAFEFALHQMPQNSKIQMKEILESAESGSSYKSRDPFCTSMHAEVSQWLGSHARVLSRINAFRAQLRLEDRFKQKSEQIIHQIRIQILLLCLMYLIMLFFVLQRFSFYQHTLSFLTSSVLFILGLLTFYFIARRKIWMI